MFLSPTAKPYPSRTMGKRRFRPASGFTSITLHDDLRTVFEPTNDVPEATPARKDADPTGSKANHAVRRAFVHSSIHPPLLALIPCIHPVRACNRALRRAARPPMPHRNVPRRSSRAASSALSHPHPIQPPQRPGRHAPTRGGAHTERKSLTRRRRVLPGGVLEGPPAITSHTETRSGAPMHDCRDRATKPALRTL